ncbi:Putative redox protein fmp46, mitochondrial [Cytospora mali]|uniref:Redox protein fmp46, mitochondrial n=1 Tax=Cytospora mali TaxID=578113 RepID=A0A194WE84_CYTMA|nr:Putative redox protein fmp46, mitochondrial [Valsa mali]
MFRFHKTKDIVTLFHKASSPASVRVASLLKQASANAAEHATEDQASDHSAQSAPDRAEFELNITEEPPTPDQLQTILQYVGKPSIPSIVKGASSESEAMKLFRQSAENFQRPVTVDWNNGKAVAGGDESQILRMLSELPKA